MTTSAGPSGGAALPLGTSRDRTWFLRLAVIIGLGSLALSPFASYPPSVGLDWPWYRNGIDRLVAGQPLYDPAWLAGPFNYLAQANVFHFNQAPWLLPIVAPFLAIPEPAATSAWLALMDAAALIAIALVVPRWPLLVLLVLIAPPVLMTLLWGNVEALVLVGVALWITGRRRDSVPVETFGIVLASLKVVPAIPLVLLAVRAGRWKAVLAAGAIVGGTTVLLSLASGQNLLEQFVRITANIEPVMTQNLSPAAWFGGSPTAELGVRLVAVLAVCLVTIRVRSDAAALPLLELASCFLATNPYLDWLVVPLIAVLAWAPVGRMAAARSDGRPTAERDRVASN